ncbi:hypothetical protein RHSIM_Rhsim05G0017700 [Rhododendron simsii]|uniref:Uncharacterized protein n=1 Tax=Rhododendron simsii TaxID=118357 RepID=A0A834H1U9_RHOSS|nr:hypothetical protein RHSIM_Rhsim05G0017700 [Rhododendron simsii]
MGPTPNTNDTEPSETSPFKGILSTSLSSGEMNENHHRIVEFFPEWNQNESDSNVGLIRRESVQTQHNTSSVGSNQFSGATQLWWWDPGCLPDFPESDFRRAFKMSKSTFEFICSELDPVINKDYTMLQLAIPLNGSDSNVGLIRRESVQTQHNTSSVGSNQFSGATQLWWWDPGCLPDFPKSDFRRAFKMSKSTFVHRHRARPGHQQGLHHAPVSHTAG